MAPSDTGRHHVEAVLSKPAGDLGLADAKACLAKQGRAIDLAVLYLRYRHLLPEQLDAFVADARPMTPLMVNHVWGCTAARVHGSTRAVTQALGTLRAKRTAAALPGQDATRPSVCPARA